MDRGPGVGEQVCETDVEGRCRGTVDRDGTQRHSELLVIRERQVTTTVRHHFTFTRMARTKPKQRNKRKPTLTKREIASISEAVKELRHDGTVKWCSSCERRFGNSSTN